jgi:5-formyltetrahydrofolate cyclo-ligase
MDPAAESQQRLTDEKRALRRLMAARREALDPAERARLSAAMTARLEAMPEMAQPRVVAGYAAIRGEIDAAAVLDAARRRAARVLLPRVNTGVPRLKFHEVAAGAVLLAGPFNLREPDPSWPEVPIEEADVVIVPGLAFDAEGRRVGYGGGYYDRVCERVREAGRGFLVGIAYEIQLVPRCPAGEHDVPVHAVVTDSRVVRP